MSPHQRKTVLLGSVAALLLLGAPAAVAKTAEPATTPAPFDMGEVMVLKPLPSSQAELTLRGESAERSFAVALSDSESKAIKTFQIAFKNTVAALPERSVLKVTVNGIDVASVPVNASAAVAVTPLTVPRAALKAGVNTVDISVVMAHRVDCSVAATYELWTMIDPAQTGFVAPASAGLAVRSINDLAAGTMSQNGATPIVFRTTGALDSAAIDRAGRLIGALVNRAGLARPVVEMSPDLGRGPGFDVVLDTHREGVDPLANLRVTGREDGLVFARDAATDRLVVVASATDTAGLDQQIATFASKVTNASVPTSREITISGETHVSLGDLGLATRSFAGRHYMQSFAINLPADFYPADYDKAQLLVDGSYASDLDPTSKLMVRVNGGTVATLRLGEERHGTLQHVPMSLPLRAFHPGRNEIVIDGLLTTPADRQCDPAAMPKDGPRLSLLDTSELMFPRFAHFGTSPHIAGALDSLRTSVADTHVYLGDAAPATVGAGLTVLANMAASGHPVASPLVRIGAVTATDVPGIVVAPWKGLPSVLSGALATQLSVADAAAGPTAPPEKTPVLPQSPAWAKIREAVNFGLITAKRTLHGEALLAGANRLLQRQGFMFGGSAAEPLSLTDHTLLVAAVDPRLQPRSISGLAVPRFASNPREWLVVAAADDAVLADGLGRLIAEGRWADLQGQVVSFDAGKDVFASVPPRDVLYIVPAQVSVPDIAPILGGLVSSNIELSLATLVALMIVLGLSTHIVIRRSGAK